MKNTAILALMLALPIPTAYAMEGKDTATAVTGLEEFTDVSLTDQKDDQPSNFQKVSIPESRWKQFLRRNGWRPRDEKKHQKEPTRRRLPEYQQEDFSCCCCVRDTGITCCLLFCCFISLNCCCGRGGSFYFTCCESE